MCKSKWCTREIGAIFCWSSSLSVSLLLSFHFVSLCSFSFAKRKRKIGVNAVYTITTDMWTHEHEHEHGLCAPYALHSTQPNRTERNVAIEISAGKENTKRFLRFHPNVMQPLLSSISGPCFVENILWVLKCTQNDVMFIVKKHDVQ